MRELRNIKAFEADYKKYFKGDLDNLDFDFVLGEVSHTDGDYELKRYESNVEATVAFFFDEELICTDAELQKYDAIATYIGNSWK